MLLVGPGAMGEEYMKVLKAMKVNTFVAGRGEKKAKEFTERHKVPVICGDIDFVIEEIGIPTHAIVAVNVECLCDVTKKLLHRGVKNILVEKPGGACEEEIDSVAKLAKEKDANVFVAYNRRFYSSTCEAMQIIERDGGVSSFNFEFTEWAHVIEKNNHMRPEIVKENWFFMNSTHVVNLAFFLGGVPKEMTCYTKGGLDWYKKASAFAGAGISDKGATFSYQANWCAPGRWGVEILTSKHRIYLKPMEELHLQELDSVKVEKQELDNKLDVMYKPGFYKQVESFIFNQDDKRLTTIEEQQEHIKVYNMMERKDA